jgi:hypothetical protein
LAKYDITQTNVAVRDLLEVTENPKHRFLLQAYDRHRNLEMAGRYEEIFAPDMTVEHPVYHFNVLDMKMTLDGMEAVEAVYREWTETAQCVFYTKDEQIAVGDNMIVSGSSLLQQTPGKLLAAAGVDADEDATYLARAYTYMIWPYDDRGRLIGEDVWEVDESQREFIELDPADVLTVEDAAAALNPLIEPLPSFDEIVQAEPVRS